jgi:quercetin dioxygenase-like cupin family protein
LPAGETCIFRGRKWLKRIRANQRRWIPSGFPGVEMCQLRGGESGGGSVLMRFEPGASFPAHDHPAGEELLVLSGSIRLGDATLEQGDYQWTPPGEVHNVQTEQGAILLVHSGAGIRVVE